MTAPAIRVGTRGSALALAQSRIVADAMSAASGRTVELVRIRTEGDLSSGPLTSIGGTGVFVTAIRKALLDNRIDVAVHSYKDLPTVDPEGLGVRVAAIPRREDPADVLCARSDLARLAVGSRIGTGSPRRAAQLLRLRRDLRVEAVRGNVDTRLRMVSSGAVDGVVLARSGLARLGRLDAVSQTFSSDEMLPAPGQGALAVECRADVDDETLLAALATLDDLHSRASATAERTLLARLEAGCAAPIGAIAWVAGRALALRARVTAADGSAALDVRLEVRIAEGAEPVTLGHSGGGARTSGAAEGAAGRSAAALGAAAASGGADSEEGDSILWAARLAGNRAADDLLARGAAALMGARQ